MKSGGFANLPEYRNVNECEALVKESPMNSKSKVPLHPD